MNERITKVALTAVGSGILGIVGSAVVPSLEMFAPCRTLYRTDQAVEGSLACQVFSAIGLASLLFLLAAVGFGVATVVLMLLRWRAMRHVHGR
jgi:hypothetical protein